MRRAARFAPHTRERDYPPHPTHARASAARRVDDASTVARAVLASRDVATEIDRIASTPRARLSTALARAFDDRSNANPSIVYPRSGAARRAAAGQRRRPWRTGRSCATRGRGRSPRTGRVRTPMYLSPNKHHHARHPIHGHTYDLITIGHGRPLGTQSTTTPTPTTTPCVRCMHDIIVVCVCAWVHARSSSGRHTHVCVCARARCRRRRWWTDAWRARGCRFAPILARWRAWWTHA